MRERECIISPFNVFAKLLYNMHLTTYDTTETDEKKKIFEYQ